MLKYIYKNINVLKMCQYISDNVEISSDVEKYDKENTAKENSDEENYSKE